ncbi:hypothetical protein P2L35_14225 [Enterococcus faecium]|nr:hypothetical protein [Enterococcus faecium]
MGCVRRTRDRTLSPWTMRQAYPAWAWTLAFHPSGQDGTRPPTPTSEIAILRLAHGVQPHKPLAPSHPSLEPAHVPEHSVARDLLHYIHAESTSFWAG